MFYVTGIVTGIILWWCLVRIIGMGEDWRKWDGRDWFAIVAPWLVLAFFLAVLWRDIQ